MPDDGKCCSEARRTSQRRWLAITGPSSTNRKFPEFKPPCRGNLLSSQILVHSVVIGATGRGSDWQITTVVNEQHDCYAWLTLPAN